MQAHNARSMQAHRATNMYHFPRESSPPGPSFAMPQDAFAAFANGFNAAIASGYNFSSTSRAAEAPTRPPLPSNWRRPTAKSLPALPKRPVLSYFEDLHAKTAGIHKTEAAAIRAELALLPNNISRDTVRPRRSDISADTGVLSAAEDGDSDYAFFSDRDTRRAVKRGRKGLSGRLTELRSFENALQREMAELRRLQRESEADYETLRILQQSLRIETEDLKKKQHDLESQCTALDRDLKGTQTLRSKLQSTHCRLKRNVDHIKQQGFEAPEILSTVADGGLFSTIRRKRKLQHALDKPLSTLQTTIMQLENESRDMERKLGVLDAQLTSEYANDRRDSRSSMERKQRISRQLSESGALPSDAEEDLVAVAILKSEVEHSVKREIDVQSQLIALRTQLARARRTASESAVDANTRLEHLKSSRTANKHIGRTASSAV